MAESSSAPRRTGYRLPPFAELIGIEVVEAGPERVVGRIQIGPQHSNGRDQAHGGAASPGGVDLGDRCLLGHEHLARETADGRRVRHGLAVVAARVRDHPKGAVTTTIESKTNFLAAARGAELKGEAMPLHIGRNTMVWQTTIRDANDRRVAVVTQTQLVLMLDQERGA